jgi:hypothetical protein
MECLILGVALVEGFDELTLESGLRLFEDTITNSAIGA